MKILVTVLRTFLRAIFSPLLSEVTEKSAWGILYPVIGCGAITAAATLLYAVCLALGIVQEGRSVTNAIPYIYLGVYGIYAFIYHLDTKFFSTPTLMLYRFRNWLLDRKYPKSDTTSNWKEHNK